MPEQEQDPFDILNSPIVGDTTGQAPFPVDMPAREVRNTPYSPHTQLSDLSRSARAEIFNHYAESTTLLDKLRQHKRYVAAVLLLGVGGCTAFSQLQGDNQMPTDDNVELLLSEHSTPTSAPEQIEVVDDSGINGDSETPLFGTVLIDREALNLESTSPPTTQAATTTEAPSTTEAATTTTEATTTTTTVPLTTTTISSVVPVETPPSPRNPYENLDCSQEYVVFERGWTATEVAANCDISFDTLVSYNPQIADFDLIITGVTKVYLQPSTSDRESVEVVSADFDCAAQVGRWTEVYPGETPVSFLMRVITSYGYTRAQADWMIDFGLVSKYQLTDGPFLAGEDRCAPTASGINVLFSEIPNI